MIELYLYWKTDVIWEDYTSLMSFLIMITCFIDVQSHTHIQTLFLILKNSRIHKDIFFIAKKQTCYNFNLPTNSLTQSTNVGAQSRCE